MSRYKLEQFALAPLLTAAGAVTAVSILNDVVKQAVDRLLTAVEPWS